MKYTYHLYFLKNRNRFNLFAALIRLANKRPYNHVEVVAIPEMGSRLPVRFYGSVWPKSRKAGIKEIMKHYDFVKCVQMSDMLNYSSEDNIKWLDSMCGKPYSIGQVLLQALEACSMTLKNLFSKVQLNHEQELICVELAIRFAVERMGYVITKSPDAGQFKDLEDAVANPWAPQKEVG